MTSTPEIALTVRFPDASVAEASQLAQALVEHISATQVERCSATVARDRADTQDGGGIVVLMLSTPALVALARGLAAFVAKKGDKIVVEKDGRVIATGAGVAELPKLLQQNRNKPTR